MEKAKVTNCHLPPELLDLGSPSATRALQHLQSGEGNAQCGLSTLCDTIRYFAICALLQQKKGLVVHASRKVRTQIINGLSEIGLAPWAFEWTEMRPAEPALQHFRDALEKKTQGDDIDTYSKMLHQFIEVRSRIERKYALIEQRVFGARTWKILTDQYALEKEPPYRKLLSAVLNPLDFECTPQEYWYLKGRIESFNQLEALKNPAFGILEKLNLKPYQNHSFETLGKTLDQMLSELIRDGEEILIQYAEFIEEYQSALRIRMLDQVRHLEVLLRKATIQIVTYREAYGARFIHETSLGTISHKIRQQFDRASREIIKARSEIKSLYLDIVRTIDQHPIEIVFQDLDLENNLVIEDILVDLERIGEQLRDWPDKLYRLLGVQCKRLNSNNVSNPGRFQYRLQQLERAFEAFKIRLNETALLSSQLELNALSLQKKSLEILRNIQHLRDLKNALPDLEEFLLWSTFQNHLPPQAKQLIDALSFLPPEARISAYSSWYFALTLEKASRTELLESPEDFEDYQQRCDAIKPGMLTHAGNILNDRRRDALRSLKKTHRRVKQDLSRHKGISIDGYRLFDRDIIAGLFPILLDDKREGAKGEDASEGYHILHVRETTDNQYVIAMQPFQQGDAGSPVYFRNALLPVDFHWQEIPLKDKLNRITLLAAQFDPFLGSLKIYNTRYVQIFSFLGQALDTWMLDILGYPYKISEAGMHPTRESLEEAFLDVRKPIVIISRDQKFGDRYTGTIDWHLELMNRLGQVGLVTINSFSAQWLKSPVSEMDRICRHIAQLATPEVYSHHPSIPEEMVSTA